jgi:hypothetical protein
VQWPDLQQASPATEAQGRADKTHRQQEILLWTNW